MYFILLVQSCFSEYLFLLTILIKPQSGFKIAFAMLDQDGNERIDKEEFKVLESSQGSSLVVALTYCPQKKIMQITAMKDD